MAWTTPMTFVSNAVLTAAQLNTHLRDNMLETAPAKATRTSGFFVGAGPNSIVERLVVTNRLPADEATSGTSYGDLTTEGPTVDVETGTRALVFLSGSLRNDTANQSAYMSYSVSGGTSVDPSDSNALQMSGLAATQSGQVGMVDLADGLTPGINTFTAKYRAGANNANFKNRFIGVFPF